MIKRIIITVILVLFVAASVYIGLRPFGMFASWQGQTLTQEQKEEAEALKLEAEEQKKAEEEQRRIEEELRKEEESLKKAEAPAKGIQVSLDAKSDQVMAVWTSYEKVHGALNILQAVDTSASFPGIIPLAGLAPYEKTFSNISKMFRFALGALAFEKTLLVLYIPLALFILIPVCVLIAIFKLIKQKDMKALPWTAVVCVMVILVILFALPVSLKLSSLADEVVLRGFTEKLISSVDKNADNAAEMEKTLTGTRRFGVEVTGYIEDIKIYSSEAVRNAIQFFVVFLITHVLAPILIITGLCLLTRFCSKLILKTDEF